MKTTIFHDWVCRVQMDHYLNGRPALTLFDLDTGAPVAKATINLPDIELRENQIIIKDYAENVGILESLMDVEIITPPVSEIQYGFITAPICILLWDGDPP